MRSVEANLAVMHTQLSCKVYGEQPEAAIEAAFAEVKRLELLLSRFLPDSEVSSINTRAGDGLVDVSPDTIEVLQEAVAIGALSSGAFDVTIAPLMNLWDFTHAATPPTQAAIKEVRSLVDYRQIRLDVKNRRAGLGKQGMLLDLGGLAKGYAADRAKQVLIEWGIESAYINLGGNVLLLGSKPDGSAWKVGIRHPRIQNSLVGAIAAKDVSVVTSGDYERFFIDSQGKRQHHILDPRTGCPARSGLIGMTVVCPRSLHADALSTTFFLSGIKGCKKLLAELPEVGVFAIDEHLMGWISESLVPVFQPVTGLNISLLSI